MSLINDIFAALGNFIHRIIAFVKLLYGHIVSWFQDRQELVHSDKDNIAFTIQDHLQNGNFRTVQGVFNKRTETMLDAAEYHTRELDHEMAVNHQGKPLVIYT